ncbi:MAG: fumarate hydratase [Kiritimatiellia bacterium]
MMDSEKLVIRLVDLIRQASTTLPPDVRNALRNAAEKCSADSSAHTILKTIEDNAALAQSRDVPACQDTGTPAFWFDLPDGTPTIPIREAVREAMSRATQAGYLRLNVILVPEERQEPHNYAPGSPVIHFRFSSPDSQPRATLLLKGGGSENQSRQYALPDHELSAGRDLEGVRKCVLDAIWKAQGNGCSPGIIGVCVGGERAGAYACAKEQLLRPLDDQNPIPALANLEARLLEEGNRLGIGPMGLGGFPTILGVKIGSLPRLPASYFVTIAYNCWACRRATISL